MIGRGVVAVLLVALAATGCGGPDPTIPQLPMLGPIPVIRGPADGDALLDDTPIGGCAVAADVMIVAPDLDAVDQAIDAASGVFGWIDVPIDRAQGAQARYFYGSLEAAAAAFGATKLAIGGRGDTWIKVADGSDHQLLEHTTPKGRSVWQTAGSQRTVPCPPGSLTGDTE